MTQKDIQIVKDTIPLLQTQGETITKCFYNELFTRYPEVKSMFNMEKQKNGEQPKALAMAVLKAAQNIEHLEKMQNFVGKVAITHTNLGVKPEHYPLVGECLLIAIKHILNPSDEVLLAWENAYKEIADYYIKLEKEIYAAK